MKQTDIARYRLYNQLISHHPHNTPLAVVSHMGAMQAQDYASAKWAIALRLPQASEADIDRAIAERQIVRTWPMRGTLHFVAAKDVRWILHLLAPRILAGSATRHKQLGLTDCDFERSREVLSEVLSGDKQCSRADILEHFEAAGISTKEQRGYHLLWRAAQEGLICCSAPNSKQQTFALLDDWAPNAKTLSREEALVELARRYFASHGPATLEDFVWWSGLKVTDARQGIAIAKDSLETCDIEGQVYWMPPMLTDTLPISDVYLLPGFDEYLLGYKDRSAVLDKAHASKVCPGNNGMFSPMIVIDGKIQGTWKRGISKKGVQITHSPFSTFNQKEKQRLESHSQQFADYLCLPLTPSN